MNYALSSYPLSKCFRDSLEKNIKNPIEYLLVSELRKLSPRKLLQTLKQLKAEELILAIENENSKVYLPILKIIAVFIPAKKILIVAENNELICFRKYQIVQCIVKIFLKTLISYLAYWRAQYETSILLPKTRQEYPLPAQGKILYLNANLWFGVVAGGSVGHVAGVINGFAAKNFQVDYVAVNSQPLLKPNINVIKIPAGNTFAIPTDLNYYNFNYKIINQLLKLQPELKYRFIYQRLSLANFSGVKLSRILRIPLILEYNSSEVWTAENWGIKLNHHNLVKKCEDICLKYANFFVTISTVLRDELISKGIDAKKIICYPNCIDPTIFNPDHFTIADNHLLRRQYNIPNDAIVLTFVGTFGVWHGVEVLALAIKKLIDLHPDLVEKNILRFIFIGDGAKMPVVKNIFSDNHYSNYIIFTGIINQKETPKYLAASNIFLSPHVKNPDGSRFFGSPTKLFEYMAMGKAIIASNLEQIGDILHNGIPVTHLPNVPPSPNSPELGVLCQPGNSDDIVSAILFLLEQPQWRKILGENARKDALAKYTWEHHVDQILNKILPEMVQE